MKRKRVSSGVDYPPYAAEKRVPTSRATLNLDRDHGDCMPNCRVGDTHEMTVKGKVTGISSDEYGHRVEMEVKPRHVRHASRERSSLTKAIKARKMKDGRFA